MNQAQEILSYHEATKHHFHRYARSAGYMDWANQPNPFRFYEGAETLDLPLTGDLAGDIAYDRLYTADAFRPQPLNAVTLGGFMAHCLGLSAWKAAGGSRWSLRINPSSGNLHPTEAYLILPAMAAMAGGVFHYNVFQHALERRMVAPQGAWSVVAQQFQGPGFLVALSSILWREAWKYGERAFRYCQLDVGHALAAIALAARLHGWTLTCLTGAGDDQISIMLGLDRTAFEPLEAEAPDLIAWVGLAEIAGDIPRTLPEDLVAAFSAADLSGRPNRLSRQVVDWSAIYRAETVARKPVTAPLTYRPDGGPALPAPPPAPGASQVIRRRRSATAYDPRKTIGADAFLSILERTRPRAGMVPFSGAGIGPAVDLLLFVHRVTDMEPGLYFLLRSGVDIAALETMGRSDLLWRPAHPDLPLWQLTRGEMTYDAMEVSCHQEIAGQSAFAVAMLAPLQRTVSDHPYLYRHLHWECGLIGQVLYLEAEAHGLRGTGIGCFFDDAVTELLGVAKNELNSLYHFTIGHPLEDPRIQTLPAYHHLAR